MKIIDPGSGLGPPIDRRPGRDVIPVRGPDPPFVHTDPADQDAHRSPTGAHREYVYGTDVRHMSPRQMAELSMDLYVGGILSYDEYALLAFQPELHPDYDATVGALTGEKAAPDQPRDYVREWEERVVFERLHNADDATRVARAERILAVLQRIDRPTDVVV